MIGIFKPLFPVLYQGASTRGIYFEGWYFRQTTNTALLVGKAVRTVSFIPGIVRSPSGSSDENSAFVQMIDGVSGKTRYFKYPIKEFSARDAPFEVTIGPNRFSLSGLSIDLEDTEGRVKAELEYGTVTPLSRRFPWLGTMGPFSFVPFMECYHGVASLDHSVDGFMTVRGTGENSQERTLRFLEGRGYIDKEWGRSLPRSWVWIQANTFGPSVGPASFYFSLARVPWLGGWFNGFMSILYVGGVEYRFASYFGAHVELLSFDGSTLSILVVDRSHKLEVTIRRGADCVLANPLTVMLGRRISSSADSWVRVVLKRRHGRADVPVFDAASTAAGVEMVGDVSSLRP